MSVPLQVIFRGIDPSDSISERARQKADKLFRLCQQITSCQVLIDVPHRQHQKGSLYQVQVRLSVPGRELIASRSPADCQAHEDVRVAMRDAFNAAERELKRYLNRRRRRVTGRFGVVESLRQVASAR